jgi:hypothetical protein
VISYCIPVYRPWYARWLISDLVRKTSAEYEILVWLNTEDAELETFLLHMQTAGHPLRIIGKTPQNIGMKALRELFAEARHDLITQIDDDVVCITPRVAEICQEVFTQFPRVKQLVADVWQDEFTTGARPEWSCYRPFDEAGGIYDGPIDGWFSVYHRSILPLLASLPFSQYFGAGCAVKANLTRQGCHGLLCNRFKVFHVIGPDYASYFNALDFEIGKYQRLGRRDIVAWYEGARSRIASRETLGGRIEAIREALRLPPATKDRSSDLHPVHV